MKIEITLDEFYQICNIVKKTQIQITKNFNINNSNIIKGDDNDLKISESFNKRKIKSNK